MPSSPSSPEPAADRATRRLAVLGSAGVLLGLGAAWLVGLGPPMAFADLAVGWVFIACGLLGWSRQPRSRMGMLFTATGFAWFLGTLADADLGPVAALGASTLMLHRGPLFHAIVGYPTGRLPDRLGRSVVIGGYGYAAVTPVARNGAATIVITVLMVAVTARAWLLSGGPERRARASAVVAAASLAAVLAVGSLARLSGSEAALEQPVLWGYQLVLATIAVGLLAGLLRGRWAQAAVTRLVVELGTPAEGSTLATRLAHALGDPSLVLGWWLEDARRYVDERGEPIELPKPGSGRQPTLIDRHGQPMAVLIHDPAIADDPELLESVAATASMAISNVRLQAQVRRQVAEVEASRRRILAAGDAQRRRLQQELRIGAERRLARVRDLLGLARQAAASAQEAEAAGQLDKAEQELRQAQLEVRELAAGIHPPLLADQGLQAALTSLVERSSVDVSLTVPPGRLPAAVEAAVYFMCSEALANVSKYAAASGVLIEVQLQDNRVVVSVADDGIGGAVPEAGSGLRGLADRVESLGGTLRVESPPGRGTRLCAEISLWNDRRTPESH